MPQAHPMDIHIHDVRQLLADEAIVLVDCREDSERETACIAGSLHLPMSRWAEVVSELDKHTGRRLVVHCHHGVRSLRVTQWLRENGFPDAQSMAGGIDAWSQSIDPTVPQY